MTLHETLTTEEACDFLKCSRSMIYYYIKHDEKFQFTYYQEKRKGRLFFLPDQLKQWQKEKANAHGQKVNCAADS